ncbi:ethylene-responsive nuclear family protein [Striga asiatica]|uniref:Ethylene-responsive nuclear family protein n=1 Tax=Striga asiatica TaxID=4170 RepID=A0A5A7PVD3_STRAF|nr:ethylene-responsive nuclear family protein [Striga asiatica]
MHLPWKKMKTARISQFVNDHLHRSQKRRDLSSLLVETGFPTSLVDLFLKNREKLKNLSKRRKGQHNPTIAGSEPPPHSISPELSPAVAFSPVRVPVETNDGLDERDCVVETCVDVNAVLFVVLKVFFVVVLALGTKRLTVGITISAFLLFLLDYVCKHARFVLKPCSKAKGALKTTVFGVLKLLRFLEVSSDQDNFSKRYECHEEIQVKKVLDEIQLQPEDEMIEERSCQEMEFKEAVSMEKEKSKTKSKKFKLKSKMKKFVPKKLRGVRKEHQQQQRVLEIDGEEDKCDFSCSDISLSSVSRRGYEEKEVDKTSAALTLCELLTTKREEGNTIEGGGLLLTWKHLVLLSVIVLAGLIEGRAFAVLIVLSWFLMLKLGEKLPQPVLFATIITCMVCQAIW